MQERAASTVLGSKEREDKCEVWLPAKMQDTWLYLIETPEKIRIRSFFFVMYRSVAVRITDTVSGTRQGLLSSRADTYL